MSKKKEKEKKNKKIEEISEKDGCKIIATNDFTTISSLKQSLLLSELGKKEPEFMMFTKKGKIKLLEIKKDTTVTIALHEKFVVKVNNADVIPVRVTEMKDDNTTEKWNIYEVPFKVLIRSITRTMYEPKNPEDAFNALLCAVDNKTGEIFKVWDVARSNAVIDSKKLKSTVDLRFDL